MSEASAQDIEKTTRKNLETIIRLSKPKEKKFLSKNIPLRKALFIEYFSSNTSVKQIEEVLSEKASLFRLVAIDYFRRFGGNAAESSKAHSSSGASCLK